MSNTNFIGRIIAGRGDRPTRFHDERGNRIPLSGLFYLPHALISYNLRLFFKYRPPVPWISYRARNFINRILRPDWTVLEFGSGMSTIWLAKRCGTLYSIEHHPKWHHTVQEILRARGVTNVNYALRDEDGYPDLSSFPEGSFDFVLIDGIQRAACAQNVLDKIKPGGWVYLDNTDASMRRMPSRDYQQAELILMKAANTKKGAFRYYTDFAPTSFVAQQGMLVQL
jgi:predicted O-methyltransferase YrrM